VRVRDEHRCATERNPIGFDVKGGDQGSDLVESAGVGEG